MALFQYFEFSTLKFTLHSWYNERLQFTAASLSGQNLISGEELKMQAIPDSMWRLLDWILSSRGSMSKMEPGSVRQTLRSFTDRKKSTNKEECLKANTRVHQAKAWKEGM